MAEVLSGPNQEMHKHEDSISQTLSPNDKGESMAIDTSDSEVQKAQLGKVSPLSSNNTGTKKTEATEEFILKRENNKNASESEPIYHVPAVTPLPEKAHVTRKRPFTELDEEENDEYLLEELEKWFVINMKLPSNLSQEYGRLLIRAGIGTIDKLTQKIQLEPNFLLNFAGIQPEDKMTLQTVLAYQLMTSQAQLAPQPTPTFQAAPSGEVGQLPVDMMTGNVPHAENVIGIIGNNPLLTVEASWYFSLVALLVGYFDRTSTKVLEVLGSIFDIISKSPKLIDAFVEKGIPKLLPTGLMMHINDLQAVDLLVRYCAIMFRQNVSAVQSFNANQGVLALVNVLEKYSAELVILQHCLDELGYIAMKDDKKMFSKTRIFPLLETIHKQYPHDIKVCGSIIQLYALLMMEFGNVSKFRSSGGPQTTSDILQYVFDKDVSLLMLICSLLRRTIKFKGIIHSYEKVNIMSQLQFARQYYERGVGVKIPETREHYSERLHIVHELNQVMQDFTSDVKE